MITITIQFEQELPRAAATAAAQLMEFCKLITEGQPLPKLVAPGQVVELKSGVTKTKPIELPPEPPDVPL